MLLNNVRDLDFTIEYQAPSAKLNSVSCDAPTLSERTSS
jgi:hypothetical protein